MEEDVALQLPRGQRVGASMDRIERIRTSGIPMIQDVKGHLALRPCLIAATLLASFTNASAADRFVRHRTPDRGTYQPPVLAEPSLEGVSIDDLSEGAVESRPAERSQLAVAPERVSSERIPSKRGVRQVSYETTASVQPQHQSGVETCSCESCSNGGYSPVPLPPGDVIYESGEFAAGCDGISCDGAYCDDMGCDSLPRFGSKHDNWFGSVELLLMFRKGDQPPPLLTTTNVATPDQETSGRLDQLGETVVLSGNGTILEEMTAGGRLTLGSWLDCYKDRSIVFRGWFAGEETYGFSANQNTNDVLTRPFFNVTDGVDPQDDTLVVAFPDLASGSVSIQADSNVYGADVSLRQLWYKGYGGTIDLLYGYQYMGLDESLRISSTSTSLDDNFNPVGSIRSITDDFDVENNFHGGQIGIASNYREGCWSFSSLAKVGFGSVRRRAELRGTDFRSIDGNNATDPNGLLIRSTNSGVHNDNTFGWVPELDFTLGWQYFPAFDVTFGYHIIAMTDALQVSGVIDPDLATNLAPAPTGAQRPSPIFRHSTYYVQGMHFGLSYIY